MSWSRDARNRVAKICRTPPGVIGLFMPEPFLPEGIGLAKGGRVHVSKGKMPHDPGASACSAHGVGKVFTPRFLRVDDGKPAEKHLQCKGISRIDHAPKIGAGQVSRERFEPWPRSGGQRPRGKTGIAGASGDQFAVEPLLFREPCHSRDRILSFLPKRIKLST